MKEDPFVRVALKAAEEVIDPPLSIEQGKALLYQVTVNNKLEVKVNPRDPKRGQSAFQTDLCVFEKYSSKSEDIYIPRVVLEFKSGLSTHDVIIYSVKARKHKQIYPYLRYGIIIGNEHKVPGKFFTHNESLDFCVAAASYKEGRLHEILAKLLKGEVEASRRLERVAFDNETVHVFRNEIIIETGTGKVV